VGEGARALGFGDWAPSGPARLGFFFFFFSNSEIYF
jgi:hypothetical protein